MITVEVRTGIWGEDKLISLDFPDSWDVKTYWPDTPAPLSNEQLEKIIESPQGQPPLRELAKGKQRPCIIVDDLSRPTPTYRVLPILLSHFADAGIPADRVRIVVGTGTHGHQDQTSLRKKLGDQAMDQCEVLVHSDLKNVKKIGKTSFGTPVYVDRDVLDCDLIIGVGGVYPQHSTGFGGGGKLALGILGRRSIMGLHYTHPAVGGKYIIDNDFRKDVTEMAKMIGLDTIYILHVNALMDVVSLMAGDHYSYYPKAAAFSHDRFLAPVAENDVDLVIANAYPLDISFTFMRKGYKPLVAAPRSAMKIMIASAYEGIGHHGLFQHVKPPRTLRLRLLYRKLAAMGLKRIMLKVFQRIMRRLAKTTHSKNTAGSSSQNQQGDMVRAIPNNTDHLWVYRTSSSDAKLPDVDSMTVMTSWKDILQEVIQQRGNENLKVRIYPCAPLQTVDT